MQDNIKRFRWQNSRETSAPDLLRDCGEKLTDRALWTQFQERFQGLIFLYLMRSLRLRRIQDDAADLVPDLAQEVYLRLVQNDGRILRAFRGTTEFSVMAFLARISASVVQDHQRHGASDKRRVNVIPIDSAKAAEIHGLGAPDSPEFDSNKLSSILSWIDIERIVEGDPDRKNARRNALIFKLHYIDGFESGEIARFPGFELTKAGVETILSRLRNRIQEK
jgi:DNA-directed RNA polymerase specialized sigma24 family protein